MKTLYVCGDSFCVSDPEYGQNWPEMLADQCPNVQVINLARDGASNYLIYLQVKEALACGADYVIYHATSSIRNEFPYLDDGATRDSIWRYRDAKTKDVAEPGMICGSWLNPHKNFSGLLPKQTVSKLRDFFTEFADLPNLIEKNFVFIQHTLHLLETSTVTWAWSRGGFEHPMFAGSTEDWNFGNAERNESNINLWDDLDSALARPYFHVTNESRRRLACDHYIKLLKLNDDTN